ncbi:rhamnosyltransferase [Bryocella elongata]|uniref:Rhamnosyltransferase n=2 Tax=Bryocella elongata TaxID=863522 RepID=A0A1H5ZAI2_9BACT|nr:rhamnosyltransferase [Bryocella elongata]
MKFGVIVPTLRAEGIWDSFAKALQENLVTSGLTASDVLVMDSSSDDATPRLVTECGFRINSIQRSEFDHGGTRQLGVMLMPDADVVVFLTQDAVLASPDALRRILGVFEDPLVAAAYGRQLPHAGAGAIEAHARFFNYPAATRIRTLEDRVHSGIKSIFFSNSFGAYRRSALLAVGGFPAGVLFGEDTIVTGKLHLAGYKTAYVADAAVLHSHAYSVREEFRRYFDIGVLHAQERWMLESFGGASSEGSRFVRSELRYLLAHEPLSIPSAAMRTVAKLGAYKLGRAERHLPAALKQSLSMNRMYWRRKAAENLN